MGRGGLYYRHSLSLGPPSQYSRPAAPTPQTITPNEDLQLIASKAAVSMADSSAADLLLELNRVKKRTAAVPIVSIAGLLLICYLGTIGAAGWIIALAVVAASGLAVYARHLDVVNGTAFLNYSLEGEAAQAFEKLQVPFRQLATCQIVWQIDASGSADAKRNARATTNFRRTEIRPGFSRPPRVQCNIEVPTLKGGSTTLYFFPDRLLVYDTAGVGAVAYTELKIDVQENHFIEHGPLPRDSRQVGTTWQYVNKNGGPDRRFNNNRQIPVMQYGVIAFSSDSGLRTLFMCSRSDAANQFRDLSSGMQRPAPVGR